MPSAALAPQLSYCLVDGHALFLDLDQDQYFGLEPDLETSLARLARDIARPGDVERLHRAGLVFAGPGTAVAPVVGFVPSTSLFDVDCSGSAHSLLAAEIMLRLLRIRWTLRRGRLRQIVDRLRLAKAECSSEPPRLHARALAFSASRRWVPIEPNCLSDSLALAFHLAARGLAADLVIGVRIKPFAAHCWVQSGSLVLNDGLEGPLEYSPILVV